MSEIIFFCIVILAILILGVYGITIAQKNKGYGLIKQNTDSMRGIAICMIAASHIAQFTSMGGIARNFVFLWGGMGVAIFFLLSGYGNYFSIQKTTSRFRWFIKRIIQILIPFVFCFIFVTMVRIFIFRAPVSWNYFIDFITLSIPGTTTWYFKIQILLYVLLVLSVIICRDKSQYILCGFVIAYICVAYGIKMENYWYITSLCFPLGYAIGKYNEKLQNGINSLPSLIISSSLFIAAFIGYRVFGSTVLEITYSLFLSIVVVFFLACFGLSSKALAFVGKHSVYVYLIHIGIAEPCYNRINNIWIATVAYVLLTALGSTVSSLISEPLNRFLLERIVKTEKNKV